MNFIDSYLSHVLARPSVEPEQADLMRKTLDSYKEDASRFLDKIFPKNNINSNINISLRPRIN